MNSISRGAHALRTPLAGLALLMSQQVLASAIVAPHGAGRDGDLAGNTVASPFDPGSALLINPAGVVSDVRDQAMSAVLLFNFSAEYQNKDSGYHGASSKTPAGLDLWYGLGEIGGWSMGLGVYGSVGAAFDLPADPEAGIDSPFLGKLSILNFGFNIGREVLPGLRVGLQIAPRYGRQEIRLPSPLGNVDFTVDGFGLSTSVGAVYAPSDTLSVGASYRARGFVDMSGDGSVGESSENVDVDFVTPEAFILGGAYRYSERLNLMAQVQWTSYEDFERGDVKFSQSSLLNQPVISDAKNRARWGMGFEYEIIEGSTLRAAYTQGEAMIEDSAVRPTLFDLDNKMVMLGYEIDYGEFQVGFTTGYMALQGRRVSAESNPYFPGRYDSSSDVTAGFRVTWRVR